ncbi:hypothetical protein [Brevibacillus sp. NRS-1366]|uniref:hypothetical protein n=1 Tax=Brevibacillus sp. NRS-1366 TaxID=3233899 RepID=UPI003D1C298D
MEAKQKIAKIAAELVQDGDTIVMGVGTTILEFARAIRGRCKLTECLISKKMIKVSKEVIVLADQSKIGIEAFGKIVPLEKISVILCDEDAPQAWVSKLGEDIVWMTAGK